MLNEQLQKLIATRFGREVKYSQDCEALSEDIFEKTGQRLGVSTLKRMFGFTGADVTPRPSTMDIIARYLGYTEDFKNISNAIASDLEISMFDTLDSVDISALKVGTRLLITYSPLRRLVLSYMGNSEFVVSESHNCKLLVGDHIKVTNLTLGFELLASSVIRNGENLGAYRAAKSGGLTSIDIIE